MSSNLDILDSSPAPEAATVEVYMLATEMTNIGKRVRMSSRMTS